MITFSQARAHAHQCGYVLDGIDAVPVEKIVSRAKSGRGAWTAVEIRHPGDGSIVYPAGYWLDDEDIPKLLAIGLDYVILEN